MPGNGYQTSYIGAAEDFRRARRSAAIQQILSRLSGKSADALPYEELRQLVGVQARKLPELKDVPLDAIVGSVGRYSDFTRSFLPKKSVVEARWAGVRIATTGLVGLPPIELYQLGEAYFVLDGNHRVSVARQLGATSIEAHVIAFETKVPLESTDELDDVILRAERVDFLTETGIDKIRPDADLQLTAPGQYRLLVVHIHTHRYFMGLDLGRDISPEESVASWYDTVYLPVIQEIREKAILAQFPDRTETDLYLWTAKHRDELREELGWEVEPRAAAADLSSQVPSTVGRAVISVGRAVLSAVTSDKPAEHSRERYDDRLFPEILVPVRGDDGGWDALAQAFEIARREGGHVRGLYVVSAEKELESAGTQVVQAEFSHRCQEAGIAATLKVASGKVTSQICMRSRFTDLVVLKLDHPPPSQPLGRLSSGFRSVLRRCSSPVLAVPVLASGLGHALLAYDGSPKAEEALFVATYMAGRWNLSLTVVTVAKSVDSAREIQASAEAYLTGYGIQSGYVQADGQAAPTILQESQDRQCDLVIMGGYGRSPVAEVSLGSVVGAILRASRVPVLICQ